MKFNRKRPLAAMGGLAVLSLLAAACGSSGSSASVAASGATAPKTTTVVTAASSVTDQVSRAQAEIAKYMAMPTFTAPGPAIDASKLRGKTILVVEHDTVSDTVVGIATAIQNAGQLLGITVDVFNGQGIISTIEQGIQQGINQKVGAILIIGVAPSVVPSSVAAVHAANIPLIGVDDSALDTSQPGQGLGQDFFGAAGANFETFGRLSADAAIVNSDGKPVNAAIFTINNPVSVAFVNGVKSVLNSCSFCTLVSTQDIEPQYWTTKLGPATSSLIVAHPDLNYIFPMADTLGLFVVAGVNQAGASGKVFVASGDGSSSGTLGLVQQGPIFIADPGASTPWMGWEAMDQTLRAMSGMQPGNPSVPIRYLDKSNLAGANLKDLTTIYGDAYVAGYKKLWGLG